MLELSFCQYTFPKVTITLNDIVKLHAEEITASVDLEGLLLTKKLKIGSLSVSLFDKLVQYKYYKASFILSNKNTDSVTKLRHMHMYCTDTIYNATEM